MLPTCRTSRQGGLSVAQAASTWLKPGYPDGERRQTIEASRHLSLQWRPRVALGPRRIKTSGTHYTPPAPYALKDNQESLLDQTDLVFIDPVGTAYSTAIAPHKNSDFWGVDEDAGSIAQFVKRHLTAFNRWNSPNSCTANLTEHPEPALLLGCFMRRAWTLMG